MKRRLRLVALLALALGACNALTDPATRLAADLAAASGDLGAEEGARLTVVHATPSAPGECEGPYRVQLDEVGALFVWCYDAHGATVSSHSSTAHGSAVATARTLIVDKPAGAPLRIELARQGGRATIVGAS